MARFRRLSGSTVLIAVIGLVVMIGAVWNTEGEGYVAHEATIISQFGLVLAMAAAFGLIARFMKVPAVLGEIVGAAVVVYYGDMFQMPLHFLREEGLTADLAVLGVGFLLLGVGLETSLHELKKVGTTSAYAASWGALVPSALCAGVSYLFFPDAPWAVHIAVGLSAAATSVGITMRVFFDLGVSRILSSVKFVKGAAVVDDVETVLMLAVFVSVVNVLMGGVSGNGAYGAIGMLIVKTVIFLGTVWFLAEKLSDDITDLIERIGVIKGTATFAILISLFAMTLGQELIVGMFAAGLIIDHDRVGRHVEHLVHIASELLVPFYFIRIGASVDLSLFFSVETLLIGAALTVAATVGKLSTYWIVRRDLSRIESLIFAVGMNPRGEVGLIVLSILHGMSVGGVNLIPDEVYAAAIFMVVATTILSLLGLSPLVKKAVNQDDSAELVPATE